MEAASGEKCCISAGPALPGGVQRQSGNGREGTGSFLHGVRDRDRPQTFRPGSAGRRGALYSGPGSGPICVRRGTESCRRKRPKASLRVRRTEQQYSERLGLAWRQDRGQPRVADGDGIRGRAGGGSGTRDRALGRAAWRPGDESGPDLPGGGLGSRSRWHSRGERRAACRGRCHRVRPDQPRTQS